MKISRFCDKLTRACAAVLSFLFILSGTVFAEPASDEEEDIYALPDVSNAPYVYLYNFENDVVLFEKGDLNLDASVSKFEE